MLGCSPCPDLECWIFSFLFILLLIYFAMPLLLPVFYVLPIYHRIITQHWLIFFESDKKKINSEKKNMFDSYMLLILDNIDNFSLLYIVLLLFFCYYYFHIDIHVVKPGTLLTMLFFFFHMYALFIWRTPNIGYFFRNKKKIQLNKSHTT